MRVLRFAGNRLAYPTLRGAGGSLVLERSWQLTLQFIMFFVISSLWVYFSHYQLCSVFFLPHNFCLIVIVFLILSASP